MKNIKNGSGTILLGEDELEVRSYLEMALRCQGYSVEMAQDGEELLSCLQSNVGTISAVLLDLVMPRKDGFETLKEIRRIDKDLPIIIVSGASSPLNVVEAMKNGATDFLGKPISPEDLRQALKPPWPKEPRPMAPLSFRKNQHPLRPGRSFWATVPRCGKFKACFVKSAGRKSLS